MHGSAGPIQPGLRCGPPILQAEPQRTVGIAAETDSRQA